MNWSDLINGFIEITGAIFVTFNIIDTLKQKKVAGVKWFSVAFFNIWGFYNIFFYPHNDLWFSFIGAITLTICNTIWTILLIKYSYETKSTERRLDI